MMECLWACLGWNLLGFVQSWNRNPCRKWHLATLAVSPEQVGPAGWRRRRTRRSGSSRCRLQRRREKHGKTKRMTLLLPTFSEKIEVNAFVLEVPHSTGTTGVFLSCCHFCWVDQMLVWSAALSKFDLKQALKAAKTIRCGWFKEPHGQSNHVFPKFTASSAISPLLWCLWSVDFLLFNSLPHKNVIWILSNSNEGPCFPLLRHANDMPRAVCRGVSWCGRFSSCSCDSVSGHSCDLCLF